MANRSKKLRKSKSSRARKRRLAQSQKSNLDFQTLEPRNLLAAVVVSTAEDLVSPTADTSSIAGLIANDGGDGISLREAIVAANNTDGADTVTFAGSVFTGGDNSLIRLTQGQLSVSEGLTFDGRSVGGVVITGDANGDDITREGTRITDVSASYGGTVGASDDFLDDNSRVLTFSGSGNLTLINLTVTGGRTTSTFAEGGGIQTSDGNVLLRSSIVSGNSTADQRAGGGGIYTDTGYVSLINSTVSGNNAFNSEGGGIRTSAGDVTLINSTVSGNIASGRNGSGGGIYTDSGIVSLTDSTVSGNISTRFSGQGGGIRTADGDVVLNNSTVSGNSTTGDSGSGGGIRTFAGNVTLTNSTVSGNGTTGDSGSGGGIRTSAGSVSLIDSNVTGNSTPGSDSKGGGISTGGGSVSLVDSSVISNSTGSSYNSSGRNSSGGGIYTDTGDVSLTNSTVVENSTYGDGGGIYASFSGLSVSLNNSTVSGNVSGDLGGGIYGRFSNVALVNSNVSENSSGNSGGGISAISGTVSVTNSTVSGNSSEASAGGVNGSTVTLTNSTVSGNSSVFGGGGISANEASLVNSTVSGNSSSRSGGGILADITSLTNSTVSGNSSGSNGGGIWSALFNSTVLVVNSTVTDNSAAGIAGGIGFEDPDRGELTLNNSIVAGNVDVGTSPDIAAVSEADNLIVEHSLIGDTTGSGISATTGSGNILNQSAILGPLADNGGLTQTHSLLPDSPAIDAGNEALAVDANGPLASDQRGGLFTRSFDDPTAPGTGVDIGAYELRVLLVDNPIDEDDGIEVVGDLSLREAIRLANDNPLLNVISFDATVFTGGDSSLIRLTQGELVISSSVSIDGTLANGLIITADTNGDDVTLPGTEITDVLASFGGTDGAADDLLDDNSRVLTFSDSTGNLTLARLTFTGGQASNSSVYGGGVLFDSSGTLTLNQAAVSGNGTSDYRGNGGGIYSRLGNVSLNESTVSENNTRGDRGRGGGIYARFGTVSLNNSAVSGNSITGSFTGGGGGGGVFNVLGSVSLINSTVSGNRSESRVGGGGGIGTVTADVSLVNSTLSGNNTTGERSYGGGIYTRSGDITLISSTFSGNSTTGDGSDGGGIYSRSGSVSLFNSTFSGNSTEGVDSNGGGIWSDDSTVSLVNSTVTGNTASGVGGGIALDAEGPEAERLTLHNSIVAGNTDSGTAPDLFAGSALADDLIVEHSLIGDTTGTGVSTTTGAGNILNQSPLLAALADNGGPTQTHALLEGSAAIGVGNNALAAGLLTDQRGETRIIDGVVDIGAFELQSPTVASVIRDEGGVLVRPDQLATFAVTFDQDVNVNAGDLLVSNDTMGVVVDTSSVGFSYDASTLTATWDFGSLPDLEASFYTFELSDTITGVNGGLALDGDSDNISGGAHLEEVYVAIPGDANLDGDVEVNDINFFLGTNTGDGATVLSNLDRPGTFVWSQGDFNGDGDVDATQLNIFTGEQSGDYAVFLANLGRNVRPISTQPLTSQTLTSQPVTTQPVVSQPLLAQSVSSDSVAIEFAATVVSSADQVSSVDAVQNRLPVVVALATPSESIPLASDDLGSVVLKSRPLLFAAQANVDASIEDVDPFADLNATFSPALLSENSPLELQGAHEQLDELFSEDSGVLQDDDASDLSVAAVDALEDASDLLSFA